jgi:pimeloyl-ACP methyl ester carboxylesterase
MESVRRLPLGPLVVVCICSMTWTPGEGLPRRGTLGVSLAPVTSELQTKYGLGPGEGALVNKALPGSGGEEASLKPGDVILSVDGDPVALASIVETIGALPVGRVAKLVIACDGERRELGVAIRERPRDPGNDLYAVIYSDVTSNGNRMRTIISKPRAPGRHPALLFIQGFAPISYDYNLDGPGLDAPILYDFAKSGFVTLRVDKPGVGDSEGGPFAKVDFVTELDIYRQALLQLKGLGEVDPDNVFIFGHSMGGAFGPVVASEIPVKGMVMYGIEARTWHEYLLDIVRYQGLLGGASYSDVDDSVRRGSRVMEMVFQDGLAPERIKKDHPDLAATVDTTFPGGLFNARTSSFWSQLENTNFASYWAKCNTHVLAVHGASDFVTYQVDHQLVADIVNSVHPGWGSFATAPSSDHIFSDWPTEAESLKHFPAGAFNPAFLGMMKDWIGEVMKGRTAG